MFIGELRFSGNYQANSGGNLVPRTARRNHPDAGLTCAKPGAEDLLGGGFQPLSIPGRLVRHVVRDGI
jgi:hypothetical protein